MPRGSSPKLCRLRIKPGIIDVHLARHWKPYLGRYSGQHKQRWAAGPPIWIRGIRWLRIGGRTFACVRLSEAGYTDVAAVYMTLCVGQDGSGDPHTTQHALASAL